MLLGISASVVSDQEVIVRVCGAEVPIRRVESRILLVFRMDARLLIVAAHVVPVVCLVHLLFGWLRTGDMLQLHDRGGCLLVAAHEIVDCILHRGTANRPILLEPVVSLPPLLVGGGALGGRLVGLEGVRFVEQGRQLLGVDVPLDPLH